MAATENEKVSWASLKNTLEENAEKYQQWAINGGKRADEYQKYADDNRQHADWIGRRWL